MKKGLLFFLVMFALLHIYSALAATYTNVENIPATCTGGTITSDTFNGGRQITCTAAGKSLTIQAWDKPTIQSAQYFEMYKQSQTGSGLSICMLSTCISDNGYAKSPNYPLSDGGSGGGQTTGTIAITSTPGGASVSVDGVAKGTTTSGSSGTLSIPNIASGTHTVAVTLTGYQTYTNNAVSVTAGQTTNLNIVLQASGGGGGSGTTYTNVQNIPATCNGGTITSDTYNGGRDITCTASGKSLRIQAWDKPTIQSAQYFEMYKTSQTGTGLTICLLSTCISDSGYAKSPNYPMTSGSGGGGTTGTIFVTTTPGGALVSVDGVAKGTTTSGSSGTLSIPNIASGTHTVAVTLTGYQTYTNNAVSVTVGQTTNLNVVLQASGGGTGTTYNNLQNIPAACTGGTITSDTYNGGRDITCTASGKSLRIQAWDKPTSTSPLYFEMYKISQTGSGLSICLLSTCISDSGYAKSPNYPLTSGSGGGGGGGGTLALTNWFDTGKTDVPPNYFHLEIQVSGQSSIHASTDWEVWNQGMTEKVWQYLNAADLHRYHTHTPDGQFVGSLAGKTQLNYGTTYNARFRFKDTNGVYTGWSPLYAFTTLTPNTGGGGFTWTAASGFKVEPFAGPLDAPVHVAAAPVGMYSSLPDNQEPWLYVTELYGKIKVIHKDGSIGTYASGLLNYDPPVFPP